MRSLLIQNLHTLDPYKMKPHLGLKMQSASVSKPAADNNFFFLYTCGYQIDDPNNSFFFIKPANLKIKKND